MQRLLSQQEWAARARDVLPEGGFGNYDPSIIIKAGKGARVWDENGKEYVDYLIGSGPMLLGHCHPEVVEAVLEQLERGTTFFANNARGIELAEEICKAVACAEMVRFVSTGGEADMYAMRAARAFTGRDKILKFEGGYHGMSAEALMSLAPKQLSNFPVAVPDSAGIPDQVREHMIIAPFNDLHTSRSFIDQYAGEIAAIIVEPLQRIVPPKPGFLQGLRQLADKHGIVLIFDEVVTGFRLGYGGAQALYGVTPDLCTLGKIIGGGLPLAALAGKSEIMRHFDRSRVSEKDFLFQIGTLSGNPLAAAAGLKSLEILRRGGVYENLFKLGARVQSFFSKLLDQAGIRHKIAGHETLFDVLFTEDDVADYRDVLRADTVTAARFNQNLRKHGIFKADSKVYPCTVLTEADLAMTEQAIFNSVSELGG